MWYLWYFGLNLIIALWVFFDARSRKMEQPILWAVRTFVIMIIVMPFYLAKRPLKEGEVREGGTAWNVIKSFAIFWTVFMFVAGMAGMISAGHVVTNARSGAEQAGAAIGTALGLGMIIGLWVVVLVGALAIGLFLKKSSIVEKGPTAALALGRSPSFSATSPEPSAPMINVKCAGCGKRYRVKGENAGLNVKCPACAAVIAIPGRAGVPPPEVAQAKPRTRRLTVGAVTLACLLVLVLVWKFWPVKESAQGQAELSVADFPSYATLATYTAVQTNAWIKSVLQRQFAGSAVVWQVYEEGNAYTVFAITQTADRSLYMFFLGTDFRTASNLNKGDSIVFKGTIFRVAEILADSAHSINALKPPDVYYIPCHGSMKIVLEADSIVKGELPATVKTPAIETFFTGVDLGPLVPTYPENATTFQRSQADDAARRYTGTLVGKLVNVRGIVQNVTVVVMDEHDNVSSFRLGRRAYSVDLGVPNNIKLQVFVFTRDEVATKAKKGDIVSSTGTIIGLAGQIYVKANTLTLGTGESAITSQPLPEPATEPHPIVVPTAPPRPERPVQAETVATESQPTQPTVQAPATTKPPRRQPGAQWEGKLVRAQWPVGRVGDIQVYYVHKGVRYPVFGWDTVQPFGLSEQTMLSVQPQDLASLPVGPAIRSVSDMKRCIAQ